jgi:hypothetical protein
MRRLIVISLAGIALSGCASMSVPGLDFLTPAPTVATLQLESMPPGAEARTSAGPSCRTPCSVSVPVAPLTVTFTLDKYQPQTVPVQPMQQTVASPLHGVRARSQSGVRAAAARGSSKAHHQASAAEARGETAACHGRGRRYRILAVPAARVVEPVPLALTYEVVPVAVASPGS